MAYRVTIAVPVEDKPQAMVVAQSTGKGSVENASYQGKCLDKSGREWAVMSGVYDDGEVKGIMGVLGDSNALTADVATSVKYAVVADDTKVIASVPPVVVFTNEAWEVLQVWGLRKVE